MILYLRTSFKEAMLGGDNNFAERQSPSLTEIVFFFFTVPLYGVEWNCLI